MSAGSPSTCRLSLTLTDVRLRPICQQKEPKLARARQIPEWSAYDREIARFAKRLAREGKMSSTALSEEVDELATVGGKKGTSKDVEIPKVEVSVVADGKGDGEETVGKPHIEL